MAKHGYSRVSTARQHADTQRDQLERLGVDQHYIVEDVISGGRWDRPKLHEVLEELEPGDELHVTKLDRLGRSLEDLSEISKRIEAAGGVLVINGKVYNPRDKMDRLFFQLLGMFAEFERELIRERTLDRIEYLRSQGVAVGRPRSTTAEQDEAIFKMSESGFSYREIRDATGLSNGVISRIVNEQRAAATLAQDPTLRREVKKRLTDREKELAKLTALFRKN